MHRLFLILFMICFLRVFDATSQDMPVHEQYMLDWTLVNPSFMGLSESTHIKLMHREQWTGIENSPRTSMLLFKRRLSERTGGIGGYLFSDRNGPEYKHGFQLSWSFQAMMNVKRYDRLVLSFGMSLKGLLHQLDEKQLGQNVYDPIIDYTVKSSFVPGANAGMLVSYKDYFAGIAFDNLLQYVDKMYNTYLEPVPPILMNIHSGAIFEIIPRVQVRPSVLYKSSFTGLHQMDFNVKFQLFSGKEIRSVYIRYANEAWLGLSYKQTLDRGNVSALALCPSFGFSMGNFTFGYLYDLGLTTLQMYHYGSHQISIGYRIFPDQYVNWGKHHIPLILEDF